VLARLAIFGALAVLGAAGVGAFLGDGPGTWQRGALSGLGALAAACVSAIAVHRALGSLALQPLAALSRVVRRETEGEQSSCEDIRLDTIEFEHFAGAMDGMLDAHRHRHRDLQRSEAELRLLGQISRIVDRQGDFEAALASCCQLICRFLCWPIGHIYVVDPDDPGRLPPGDIWHISVPNLAQEFIDRSRAQGFESGVELPGRVLENGEAVWIEDVHEQDWFERPYAEAIGGAVAFPVSVASDVMAVVELFDVEPRPREIRSLALMHNIELTLGQAMHRRRSNELLLRRHRELAHALRAAKAAAEAKSTFLANMSHELRTPMMSILGYAELFPEARSKAERGEYSGTVRRNAEHLLGLIDEILDVSKIESGKLTVERIPCAPADLLRRVREVIEPRAAEKGLAFELGYDGPVPEEILTDPTRVQQILLNLLGNAVKFTQEGCVRLLVGLAAPVEDQERMLWFAVEDTGIGIDPADRERVFKPFSQADMSTTRLFGGTGLGLSISRSLAGLLGGDVTIEDKTGPGSRFVTTVQVGTLDEVRLFDSALEALAHHVETPPESPALRDEPSLNGFRVLLAEDSEDSQRLISRILSLAGAKVEIVANGQLAYERAMEEKAAENEFDVILMDMHMPVLDGYTATRRLRDEGYRGRIIALTANAMEGDSDKCRAAGCDVYLSKPIPKGRLIEAIAGD
jgi:signal transduction histidine kinase/CheY-like chemotaxis protein